MDYQRPATFSHQSPGPSTGTSRRDRNQTDGLERTRPVLSAVCRKNSCREATMSGDAERDQAGIASSGPAGRASARAEALAEIKGLGTRMGLPLGSGRARRRGDGTAGAAPLRRSPRRSRCGSAECPRQPALRRSRRWSARRRATQGMRLVQAADAANPRRPVTGEWDLGGPSSPGRAQDRQTVRAQDPATLCRSRNRRAPRPGRAR